MPVWYLIFINDQPSSTVSLTHVGEKINDNNNAEILLHKSKHGWTELVNNQLKVQRPQIKALLF